MRLEVPPRLDKLQVKLKAKKMNFLWAEVSMNVAFFHSQ